MRLPLIVPSPAVTYEYRVNGATSETGVNADGEFWLGLFERHHERRIRPELAGVRATTRSGKW